MDQAVALVETYLRVNGYFTVTEYPILEAFKDGDVHSATDLDVLAVRFPEAGRVLQGGRRISGIFAPDPELGSSADRVDMIIGEVKEGKAELNAAATNPAVLSAALVRFGCCRAEDVGGVVQSLLRRGETVTHCGHRIRLIAFGSSTGNAARRPYKVVLLRQVSDFLRTYIREHWHVIRHAQFKDPIFGLLAMEHKSRGIETGFEAPAG